MWLLDAGGFSTAPVAPGRYVFSAGTCGVSIPGGGMAGGSGVPGPEGVMLWLSWEEAEVAGGQEGAAASGAQRRSARSHPPVCGWCLGAGVSAGNI